MPKKIKVKIVENGMVFDSFTTCAVWIAKDTGIKISSAKTLISHYISGKTHYTKQKYKTQDGKEHICLAKKKVYSVNKYTVEKIPIV